MLALAVAQLRGDDEHVGCRDGVDVVAAVLVDPRLAGVARLTVPHGVAIPVPPAPVARTLSSNSKQNATSPAAEACAAICVICASAVP